jgi:hypothetical protein
MRSPAADRRVAYALPRSTKDAVVRDAELGDLWVRTYHAEHADTHPLLLDRLWELHPLQPTVREWHVFDAEGVPVRQVAIPRGFDLRVIGDGEAFGFLTLETGEVAIGRVDFS